jgi:hypothetical protein
MLIEGPLKFSVAQDETSPGYELFLSFTEEFQGGTLGEQGAAFRDYVASLAGQIGNSALDEQNQQGMMMVHQIAEQLLPHVVNGDLALDETINIHIRPDTPEVSLIDLLKQ